ncbi:hypothetical protein [Nonomuraea sp. KM90]|uniref:hypothetical protein n=1 Tax=Nonomuraea sp. KM90 TaxID=3457428 RepID=UPI003FCE38C9
MTLTDASDREIAVYTETMTILKEHKKRQTSERLAAGKDWMDSGLVLTDELGRPLHPQQATDRFLNRAGFLGDLGVPRVEWRLRTYSARSGWLCSLHAARPEAGTGERGGLKCGPTWENAIKIIPYISPDHGLTAACGHRQLPIKVTKQKTCGCETAGQGPGMPI